MHQTGRKRTISTDLFLPLDLLASSYIYLISETDDNPDS
jgi:hypothetical protein